MQIVYLIQKKIEKDLVNLMLCSLCRETSEEWKATQSLSYPNKDTYPSFSKSFPLHTLRWNFSFYWRSARINDSCQRNNTKKPLKTLNNFPITTWNSEIYSLIHNKFLNQATNCKDDKNWKCKSHMFLASPGEWGNVQRKI